MMGSIPAGLPVPHIPTVALGDLAPLTVGASTIVLVSFCIMTTARGFATRNGYQIDAKWRSPVLRDFSHHARNIGVAATIGGQYQSTRVREAIEAFYRRRNQPPELETSK